MVIIFIDYSPTFFRGGKRFSLGASVLGKSCAGDFFGCDCCPGGAFGAATGPFSSFFTG